MALDLSKLSIDEIRKRYVKGDEPITPHVLRKLKRDQREGVRRLYRTLKKRHDDQKQEDLRLDAMLNFERVLWRSGIRHIAGVDEAGVGPLAGPVVAAAIVFPPETSLEGVDDSKRLDPEQRKALANEIQEAASGIGIGVAEPEEIDQLNIYHAALLAMRRAVGGLPMTPEHVLVDARTIPELSMPQNPFNKGDGINFSIAAASIIAKNHRDTLLEQLDREYPGYGFAKHKGYGTREHRDCIRKLGPCPIHRKSFPVIHELCGEYSGRFYSLQQKLEGAVSRELLTEVEGELQAQAETLSELEQRKLRLTLGRRWKLL